MGNTNNHRPFEKAWMLRAVLGATALTVLLTASCGDSTSGPGQQDSRDDIGSLDLRADLADSGIGDLADLPPDLIPGDQGHQPDQAGDIAPDAPDAADAGEVDAPAPIPCEETAQCDESEETAGWLCIEETCLLCQVNADCQDDPYYGEFAYCDEDFGCLVPVTCATANCGEHQLCQESVNGADASCLWDCEEGWIWNDADGSCEAELNCAEGAPGSILEQCSDENRACLKTTGSAECGECLDWFVDKDGDCLAVVACDELTCLEDGQECVPETATSDALCGDCLPGYVPGELFGEPGCFLTNCNKGMPGTIATQCEQQFRICLQEEGEPAACGECWAGYKESGGMCKLVATCQSLQCHLQHRLCTPATLHADAVCGTCSGGYTPVNGQCTPAAGATCTPGVEGSIYLACQSEKRTCVEEDDNAACGGCLDGFVDQNGDGKCEVTLSCAMLNCSGQNRYCDQQPFPHCSDCLPDYKVDKSSGKCTKRITCDDLKCAKEGLACAPGAGNVDAYCFPACPDGQARLDDFCLPCSVACGDDPGEAEGGLWPVTSAGGKCICTTLDGYYFDGVKGVALPCDSDGDGWVTQAAADALGSQDPPLIINARCSVRTIDRFVLRNERDESHTIEPLSATIPAMVGHTLTLVEADFLDDSTTPGYQALPAYGGRKLLASELNALTRFCVAGGDFNGNGIADSDEAQDPALTGAPAANPFTAFAYFGELHRGWYEPPAEGFKHGRYVIQEKQRFEGGQGLQVPVTYDWTMEQASLDASWLPEGAGADEKAALAKSLMQCEVWPNPAVVGDDAAPGGDFARFGPSLPTYDFARQLPPQSDGWDGMNHHSQFRCVTVVDELPQDPAAAQNKVAAGGWIDGDSHLVFQANGCSAEGTQDLPVSNPPLTEGLANPSDPELTCQAVSGPGLAAGTTGWVAVRYRPGAAYSGGCINQCWASRGRCGLCGLGRWLNGDGEYCGPGHWEAGAAGIPGACENLVLPESVSPAELDCDSPANQGSFLFVSGDLGDDAFPGTRTEPLATLAAAVDLATASRDEALAAGSPGDRMIVIGEGTYAGPLHLAEQVHLYGGFSGDVAPDASGTSFDYDTPPAGESPDGVADWLAPVPGEVPTVVLSTTVEYPEEDGNHAAIRGAVAAGIVTETVVSSLTIETEAAPEQESGTVTSIPLVAMDSPGLRLRRVHLVAGKGGKGADGAPGTVGDSGKGGAGPVAGENKSCSLSAGGEGGLQDDTDGKVSPMGATGGSGGEEGSSVGLEGAAGQSAPGGSDGTGGSSAFRIVPDFGVVSAGDGTPGQGGFDGRGGGGGGAYVHSDGTVPGGGGGAGGCGGGGGGAGLGGGGSIGLVSVGSYGMTLEDCTISAADAGAGGAGGYAGFGGLGGHGAKPSGLAGAGGKGGSGGPGGIGGPGAGGSSIGVFYCWPGEGASFERTCPEGWSSLAPYGCFLSPEEQLPWSDAKTACADLDGHLADIHSLHELTMVADMHTWDLWIGLHDPLQDGTYQWVDGSTDVPDLWATNEPDGVNTDQHCGLVNSSKEDGFLDWHCDQSRRFVCKRPYEETGTTTIEVGAAGSAASPGADAGVSAPFLKCDLAEECVVADCSDAGCAQELDDGVGCALDRPCEPDGVCSGGLCESSGDNPCNDGDDTTWDQCTDDAECLLQGPASGAEYCPEGWQAMPPHGCYRLADNCLGDGGCNFDQAVRECVALGGGAAAIESASENEAVLPLLSRATWTGGNRRYGTDLRWHRPASPGFENWNGGEPNNTNEQCIEVRGSDGKWNDLNCSTKRVVICETDALPCRPGWTWLAPHGCFQVAPTTMTWTDGYALCKVMGGAMASAGSLAENQAIHDLVVEKWGSAANFWIGLNDIEVPGNDVLVWAASAELRYGHWADGHPAGLAPTNSCVQMLPESGLWQTSGCSNAGRDALCERNALPCPEGCDDGNPCTADGCDPIAGCFHLPATAGTQCNDGHFCTDDDACYDGECQGTPYAPSVNKWMCDDFGDGSFDGNIWSVLDYQNGPLVIEEDGALKLAGFSFPGAATAGSFAAVSNEDYLRWQVEVLWESVSGSTGEKGWSIVVRSEMDWIPEGYLDTAVMGHLTSGAANFNDGPGRYAIELNHDYNPMEATITRNGEYLRTVTMPNYTLDSFQLLLQTSDASNTRSVVLLGGARGEENYDIL